MNRNLVLCSRGAALALTLAAAAAGNAMAESETGGAPGEWLSQYSSARTLGMGSAFVATADDALGVLWNPAGLSGMDQNQLRFETAKLFEDTSINGFGMAVPGNWLPSFGLSMVTLRSGEFQKTNELNDALGTFREGETAYLFTMSRNFTPRLAVGTNLKLVQQTVEDFSGQGFGFDLGAVMHLTPSLRVGATAQNLGGPSIKLRATDETYPSELRGGFALAVLGGRGMITGQVDHANGPGTRAHGGAEYWIQPGMALRVGYDQDRGTGGFSYRFTPQYQLDYAVADHALGLTHRVGLSYQFGGFFASSHADPQVFSPTGEHAVTQISLNARTKAEPKEWSLDILNKANETVRRFGGPGQPPAHLLWDGKDETGMPLADGFYRYSLVVRDNEGRILSSATRSVEIATGGPQGNVPVIPVQ